MPLDLLILGSGVAGLSAAVQAADTHGLAVGVLTKGELHQSTTRWAQGGVAAVLGGDPDSTDAHLADTLKAGAGLCDADAVRVLVDEGPGRVIDLIARGASFDQDPAGEYLLAREGGHSHARILHAGGAATGLEVERALVEAVHATAAALHENTFALDLIVEDGRCAGVRAVDAGGQIVEVAARHVLLATGGAGQLFAVTTNPLEATGDGIAMALRAGVPVADAEFVQFHPTALHRPAMPRPLLSEALRGHGAMLRDSNGDRFVDELLPRDQVSRAITRVLLDQDVDHVWLDLSPVEHFSRRFPTISETMESFGFDLSTDWLPVAPAAHYSCGGVVTDLDGASALPGLWAAGETSCSGVHGANRLASNSLLDGMVFGARVVEAVDAGRDGPQCTGAMRCVMDPTGDHDSRGRFLDGWSPPPPNAAARFTNLPPGDLPSVRATLQEVMTRGAGVLRSAESLGETASVLDGLGAYISEEGGSGVYPGGAPLRAAAELANLHQIAEALVFGAQERKESRGSHTREDHPGVNNDLQQRFVLGSPAYL